MSRLKARLIGAAIIVPLIIGWQVYNKNRVSDSIKADTYDLVQKLPSYATDQAYIDRIFESSYDAAFESSRNMGGRYRAASFDASKYVAIVFDNMIAAAARDGKMQLVTELRGMKVVLLAAAQEEEDE
ncbi:MAG TPA: hypothetical protein P5279_09680 [Anaerohalosphaeraceae bacterium]|jgi:hypothetical protein|nr:hypothetical protein [Anaerohalosphaeraceae bacterium]